MLLCFALFFVGILNLFPFKMRREIFTAFRLKERQLNLTETKLIFARKNKSEIIKNKKKIINKSFIIKYSMSVLIHQIEPVKK